MATSVFSRSEVYSRKGLVCSVSPLAATAGISVLKEGGNAFDAAIAVAAVEGVTVTPMCGLGADVFAILYEASTGRVFGLNSSGVVPQGATPEYLRSQGHTTMPLQGPHSISVPGEVAAWETIQQRFGTMPLSRLLEPAIGHAEEGYPVPPKMPVYYERKLDDLRASPSMARVLTNDGKPWQEGDLVVQRDLAASLWRVAEGGAEEFYRGDLARRIVKGIRDAGGLFTEEDFAGHQAELYEPPISTTYRGRTVYQSRPVSHGYTLLEMLNLAEGFDLTSLGHNSAEAIHLMVEMTRLAYADRNKYAGDPKFIDWPLERLCSKEYADEIRSRIDPNRASASTLAAGAPTGDNTSYFCVADGRGNAVSFIHSLSAAFGSLLIPEGTGILLNNRAGRGFSLQEGHPNIIAPGKRTMHTLNCYMIFEDGRPVLVGGTPGGDFQPQGNLQIITGLLDWGLGLQEVVEAPRWRSHPCTDPATLGDPVRLEVEEHMPPETVEGLAARGHQMAGMPPEDLETRAGLIQLIAFDHQRGVMMGASDPRADGHAVGL